MDKEENSLTQGERDFVEALLDLPHKIICHQHVDGLANVVLHDIARPSGFGLAKAAYLVDNPDFDCLSGVAGYSCDEYESDERISLDNVWADPGNFIEVIGQTPFNERVRGFRSGSLRLREDPTSRQAAIQEIGRALGIQNPSIIDWSMRHDNHGVLIFEQKNEHKHSSLLASVAAFLGLCAI